MTPKKVTPDQSITVQAAPVTPIEVPKTAVEIAKEKKAALAAEKARLAKARKEGVSIGMSTTEVLESSWGKPKSVNRSTNAYGTREQWVYGGNNYLYFKNGVLTSIQN